MGIKSKFALIIGNITILFLLSSIAFLWLYRLNVIKLYAIPQLEKIAGFPINGEVISLSLTQGFKIKNLSLGDKENPILRANDASVDIALSGYLLDYLRGRESNEIIFSKIQLNNAILSARQLEDGTFIFFPEVKSPKTIKREIPLDERKKWLIKAIEFIDSSIEIELRSIKKQISFGKINGELENLGNGKIASLTGDSQLFIRDFGINSFVENNEYSNALNTQMRVSAFTLGLGLDSHINDISLSTELHKSSLYLGQYHVRSDSLSLAADLEHAKNWSLKELKFSDNHNLFASNLKRIAADDPELKYKFEILVPETNLSAIRVFFPDIDERYLNGKILDFNLSGTCSFADVSKTKDSLNAESTFYIEDVLLPRELIEIVPFNIIFLPFTTLSSVFSLIPDQMLPDSLIDLGKQVSQTVKDSQTFKLKEGEFKIKLEDRIIELNEARIGTDITGDIYFGGTIDFDRNIKINSGLSVLGIRLPLPISGTLDNPHPDPESFFTALFSEFGLSIITLPVTIVEGIIGIFDSGEKKEK